MGSLSIWHWLIVLIIVILLFGGGGKLISIMTDLGKGLKAFKHTIEENPDSTEENSDSMKDSKSKSNKKNTDKKDKIHGIHRDT